MSSSGRYAVTGVPVSAINASVGFVHDPTPNVTVLVAVVTGVAAPTACLSTKPNSANSKSITSANAC